MMNVKKLIHREREGVIDNLNKLAVKGAEKERVEKKAQNKEIQTVLTKNLETAYATIKPTIIQAQRILKIVDDVVKKFNITKFLNFEFLKPFENDERLKESGLNQDLVASISRPTFLLMRKVAGIQNEIEVVLAMDYQSVSQAADEEEDEFDKKHELDDESQSKQEQVNEVNEEEVKAKIEREKQVHELRLKMGGEFKSLIRSVSNCPKDEDILRVRQV
jgi:hypothetical protein